MPESVTVHECGHQFFYALVGNNEFEAAWLDEGLNSFLQFLAEREWEERYITPWKAKPRFITDYMSGGDQVPIMTNSESINRSNRFHRRMHALTA